MVNILLIYLFHSPHLPPNPLPRLLEYRLRELGRPRPVFELLPIEKQFQEPIPEFPEVTPVQMV